MAALTCQLRLEENSSEPVDSGRERLFVPESWDFAGSYPSGSIQKDPA